MDGDDGGVSGSDADGESGGNRYRSRRTLMFTVYLSVPLMDASSTGSGTARILVAKIGSGLVVQAVSLKVDRPRWALVSSRMLMREQ